MSPVPMVTHGWRWESSELQEVEGAVPISSFAWSVEKIGYAVNFPYTSHWAVQPRAKVLMIKSNSSAKVSASVALLTQLLDKLVGNAFKCSQPGTPIEIAVQKNGNSVSIPVTDQGIGIAPGEPCFESSQTAAPMVPDTFVCRSSSSQVAWVPKLPVTASLLPKRAAFHEVSLGL